MRIYGVAVFMVILILSTSTASAQGGGFSGTVTADDLNVRAAPGLNAPVVGTFDNGVVVSIAGREDKQGNGGIWIQVSGNGISGWILLDYIAYNFDFDSLPILAGDSAAPASNGGGESAPPSGGIVAEVLQDANVRSGPGANYNRVFGATAGSSVTLTGRSTDSSWLRGSFSQGEGWIAVGLVNPAGNVTTLPVTDSGSNTAAPSVTGETPAQPAAENVAPPPPVIGGGGLSGFAYGAHIAHMGDSNLMASTGMTWMKIQVRYNRGDNPDGYGGMINDAHARGFRLLLGVVGNPADISAGGDAYFQDYAGFVAGLARNGVDAIEVWNEPNLDREWPTGSVDPAQYTRLLALSFNAIKGANPGTTVISGAPAPTGFFGGCSPAGCDDAVYLAGMKAAGAASYMDCVGAHYNEGIVSPNQTSGDPRSEFYTRYFWGMVNTYYNTMGKPVCFTELGYVTPDGYGAMPAGFEWGNNNTIEEHAQWIADAISLAAGSGQVRLVIIWNFNIQTPAGSPDPAGGYAMLRPDGSCPACAVLAARR
jgi:uncharacterized protein YraI